MVLSSIILLSLLCSNSFQMHGISVGHDGGTAKMDVTGERASDGGVLTRGEMKEIL